MRWRTLFCALSFVVALGVATPASACMFNYVGPGPSERQLRAQLRAYYDALLRQRSTEVEAALAGGVDPVAELTTMLVPNIRAVPVEETDCGPVREADSAFDRFSFDGYLAGTYLAGYERQFGYLALDHPDVLFGPVCNAEFRERFAAYIRRRLDDRQLRAAYLFLGARWRGREPTLFRIMRFREWRVRRPPVEWSTSYPLDIQRWVQSTDEGRAVQQVIDDFWRENGPLVDDNARACPATVARWPEIQARLVAVIEAENRALTEQIRSVRLRQARSQAGSAPVPRPR
jgi:hypothetical protein